MLGTHVTSLYRLLLPLPFWMAYFCDHDHLSGSVVYVTFSVYLGIKLLGIAIVLRTAFVALRATCTGELPYGVRTKLSDEGEAAMCPICHDCLKQPLQLACTHTFCEPCIATWLQRERTCPLCRAIVPDAGVATITLPPPLVFFF